MAATAVYASITRVRTDAIPADSYSVTAGDGTATFNLKGGMYAVDVIASTYGTVTLQRLGPDGTTYLTVLTAFSANGSATAYLSAGKYKLLLG